MLSGMDTIMRYSFAPYFLLPPALLSKGKFPLLFLSALHASLTSPGLLSKIALLHCGRDKEAGATGVYFSNDKMGGGDVHTFHPSPLLLPA